MSVDQVEAICDRISRESTLIHVRTMVLGFVRSKRGFNI
jgi:hypothetical protein